MKKLFLILVIGAAFTACNSAENNDYSDSTTGVDYVAPGTNMTDTMGAGMVDTTNMGAGVMDSTAPTVMP